MDKVNNQGIVLLGFGVLDMAKFGLVSWTWFVWLTVLIIGSVLHPFLFSLAILGWFDMVWLVWPIWLGLV